MIDSNAYSVWIRDDWGMDFLFEVPEKDVAVVMSTFKVVLCGRSIILQ